jgi:hypothetical protein
VGESDVARARPGVRLIDVPQLRERIVDVWLDRAPARLAEAYRGEHPAPGDPPA